MSQGNLLHIYKGFSLQELMEIEYKPLVINMVGDKVDIDKLNDDYKRDLLSKIMSMEDECYVTYEEFVLLLELGVDLLKLANIEYIIHRNLLYPEYYPLCDTSSKMVKAVKSLYEYLNDYNEEKKISILAKQAERFYGDVLILNGKIYISYKNGEREHINAGLNIHYLENGNSSFEKLGLKKITSDSVEEAFEITNDVISYLEMVHYVVEMESGAIIGIRINDKSRFDKIFCENFLFMLKAYDVECYEIIERIAEREYRSILDEMLFEIWGYKDFKELNVYKDPDNGKEVVKISQAHIIEEIIKQAEKAFINKNYKDIFITAPTGGGKSLIFQMAALYLAKKHGKLSIVISPLIALMKDQVRKIKECGINNVEYINSELNHNQKENILDRIRDGQVDMLYLAPETLLSYSIENFIGGREIGAFIVDESHIVTTWGKGFRPDYWYLGKYISKIRNYNFQFPIVTFTATAVYGGNDDMYDDTIESLNMRSTVRYLGKIRRDNDIKFDIKLRDKISGSEEYRIAKKEYLLELIMNNIDKNRKTLVYFPYASTAGEMIHEVEFADYKNKISIYTAKVNKEAKALAEKDFRVGDRPILFATKAFGMGIDIPDIEEVYHYAPTGNLNDYVQEIGRAARGKECIGIASMDYLENDFKFVKMLYGMSAIRQFQIKSVLRKLFEVYMVRQRRNFLVTPSDFSYIFPHEARNGQSALERKIKTVLLMTEKDLELQFGFPVLISRPKSIFSKAYMVVDKEIEEELHSSKYGRYFSKLKNGRCDELNGSVKITDFGDVYLVDLKRLWEDNYPDLSFAGFKYNFLNKSDKLGFKYANSLHLRYKINLSTREGLKVSDIKKNLIQEIKKVNCILDGFKDKNKMFTKQEFTEELIKIYSDRERATSIASSYIDLISPKERSGLPARNCIEFNGLIKKYQIKTRGYHTFIREFVSRSSLLNRCTSEKSEVCFYQAYSQNNEFDIFRAIYMLQLFGIANYEILGGESPEIFIRLNDPMKIARISAQNSVYSNQILKSVKLRHDRSISILTHFIKEIDSDEERWDFIEDYFLGKDLLPEKQESSI